MHLHAGDLDAARRFYRDALDSPTPFAYPTSRWPTRRTTPLDGLQPSSNVNDKRYPDDMASIGRYQVGTVLGAVGSRTGFLLSTLGQESLLHSRDVLAQHHLTPRQLRILDLLADRGAIGQREFGELMAIDHSILVNLLNPLETSKLIKRKRDTNDRRRHLVTITSAGKRRLTQADQAFRDAEDAFFGPLTPEQRDQLHNLLLTLSDANQPQIEKLSA
jgi:DNA-binding MarR family transcriptional regulator